MPKIVHTTIVLLLLSFASPANAAGLLPGARPFWNGIGLSFGSTVGPAAPVIYGHLTLGLRLMILVPELTLREGVVGSGTPSARQVGDVAAGVRILLPSIPILVPSLRVAFTHQHELPWADFTAMPIQALLGVHKNTTHRTGIEGGLGLELRPDPLGVLGIWAQANALVFPGTPGPPVTVLAEIGIALSFGPR